jgi:hypothetical protein
MQICMAGMRNCWPLSRVRDFTNQSKSVILRWSPGLSGQLGDTKMGMIHYSTAKESPKESQAQELERLRRENAALKANAGVRVKVNPEKGTISVYGIGRWPATLYASQWRQVMAVIGQIETIIADNPDLLVRKDS